MPPTIPTDGQLDEHVELLMRGCEYGDQHLAAAMRSRLKDRLLAAKRERRGLRVYTGYTLKVGPRRYYRTIIR